MGHFFVSAPARSCIARRAGLRLRLTIPNSRTRQLRAYWSTFLPSFKQGSFARHVRAIFCQCARSTPTSPPGVQLEKRVVMDPYANELWEAAAEASRAAREALHAATAAAPTPDQVAVLRSLVEVERLAWARYFAHLNRNVPDAG
jgi:hypothetical protein